MTDVIVQVKVHTLRFEPLSELVAIVEDAMSGMQDNSRDEFGTPEFTWFVKGAEPEFVQRDRERLLNDRSSN